MKLPPDTYILDIDGTLVEYDFDVFTGKKDMKVLPGVLEKLKEWKEQGSQIVLVTGRGEKSSSAPREVTEAQLKKAGIPYDHLVIGVGGGRRILVNDTKPDGTVTAIAYSVDRNSGLNGVNPQVVCE